MSEYVTPTIDLIRISDGAIIKVPRDCKWDERQQSNSIAQEIDYTIGGSAVIWNGKRLGGIPFTLSSREGVWFSKEQAEALVSEAENFMDEKYTITLPTGETKELCWRHEPAVVFETVELTESSDMSSAVFTGILKFWI